VDGSGSGLDADLLDGLAASNFQNRGTVTTCSGGQKVTGIGVDGNVSCGSDATGGAVGSLTRASGAPVAVTSIFPNYTTVMSVDIPAGAYAVFARFTLYQDDKDDAGTNDYADAFCKLTAVGAGEDMDFADSRSGQPIIVSNPNGRIGMSAKSLTLMGISNLGAPRTLQLLCAKEIAAADKAVVQVQRASIMTIGLQSATVTQQ
jgi:hypothetical protein